MRRQAKEAEAKKKADLAEAAEPVTDLGTEAAHDDEAADQDEPDDLDDPSQQRRFKLVWWWPAVAVSAAILVLCGALFGSRLLHQAASRTRLHLRDLKSQFETGARQDVVNLMSLNFNSAQVDLQRVIDSTTGRSTTTSRRATKTSCR